MSDSINLIVINLFELIAAIAGTVYISRYQVDRSTRYLVFFLWLNVFVEVVFGWLPTFVEIFNSFKFLEDTIFARNKWIYNTFEVVSSLFYLLYFANLIESNKNKKIGLNIIAIYVIFSVFNLAFSDVFFTSSSAPNSIFGTLLLVLFIMYFYFQILQSDEILNFYKTIPFYVSIGALVFHLIVNPIFIYEQYYSNTVSPEFVRIFLTILTIVNIFMYSCYTIGFLVCSKRNKSY
ncbi:hypothetical protein [uncultured Aquimarina sp.]|uniref:hypothetical protein n=1 Tax=uncultured Aquimarina sp. TaxID=575652 RepID=UPI00261C92F6|nr:hypothetical protein [uncultured Aquimarina sp.]